MPRHVVPPTTHTLELDQIAELNARLGAAHAPTVTAAELGVDDVPPGSVLTRLATEGPPEFPYVWGHFADGTTADLHTGALRELSHRLGLHHRWGV